ncbi:MAG TPA: endonuclease/exonuclease/phosphatase family protein, partial [Candidatus Binatia bacterium]|nr:endonuclease/exonuclease/phosphatase family protein [Candidatus Binatia bacterium]
RGRVEMLCHGSVFSPARHDGAARAPILSPTPHVVTWARVRTPSGATCVVYNTHRGLLPWTGGRVAGELLAILDRDWRDEPQILVGDFNAPSSWPLVRSLTAERNGGIPPLRDAWRDAAVRTGPAGTFHWGFGLPGPRLDYILVRPRCAITRVETLGSRIGGAFPSDHFALVAELELS